MGRKGFNSMVVYLDDFLIIGETKEACQAAFDALLSLLQNLGFHISWKKVVYPTQRLVFLGVLLDTVQCSMSLPEDKLEALRSYLLEFSLCCRASKTQLQVLAGKLNWACRVVYGGRTFLRHILDQINQLNSPNAKFKFNQEFCVDLSWWISFLSVFNGKCFFSRGYLLLMYKQMHPHMGQVPFFVEIGFTIPLSWTLLPWEICTLIIKRFLPLSLLLNVGVINRGIIMLLYNLTILLQLVY